MNVFFDSITFELMWNLCLTLNLDVGFICMFLPVLTVGLITAIPT